MLASRGGGIGVTDLRRGSELLGYRIERVLGRGGMGVVYLAHHLVLDRIVALKVLAPELAEDRRFRERFLRESRLAASLEHSSIVPIYDAGEVDGRLYIAMRNVEGTDLRRLLDDSAPLEPARALALLRPVADALDTAHASGLVHRDVKPANILVGEDGRTYLADFGLTKEVAERGLVEGSHFAASVDYVAPEQIEQAPVGPSADVYSLGCVLFECLAGQPPYRSGSVLSALFGHLNEPPPRASERSAVLQPAIDGVFEKALAKHPAERYASCREFVTAAEEALGLKVKPPLLSRRELLMAGAGLAVVAAAVSTFVLTRGGGGTLPGLARVDPRTGKVTRLRSPRGASAIAVGNGAVWMANSSLGAVTRVDLDTGETREVPTDGTPSRLVLYGRTLVAVNGPPSPHKVALIDTKTLKLRGAVTLQGSGYAEAASVAAGDEGVWLVNINENAARRVLLSPRLALGAARTLFTADEWAENGSFNGICVGFGAVWITGDALNPLLFEIDPRARRIERIGLPFAPKRIAAGAGALWITDQLGNAVWRIDPQTKASTRIAVGTGPNGIAVGQDAVWVANALGGTLSRIDPRRRKLLAEVDLGDGFGEVATGAGGVWALRSSV